MNKDRRRNKAYLFELEEVSLPELPVELPLLLPPLMLPVPELLPLPDVLPLPLVPIPLVVLLELPGLVLAVPLLELPVPLLPAPALLLGELEEPDDGEVLSRLHAVKARQPATSTPKIRDLLLVMSKSLRDMSGCDAEQVSQQSKLNAVGAILLIWWGDTYVLTGVERPAACSATRRSKFRSQLAKIAMPFLATGAAVVGPAHLQGKWRASDMVPITHNVSLAFLLIIRC